MNQLITSLIILISLTWTLSEAGLADFCLTCYTGETSDSFPHAETPLKATQLARTFGHRLTAVEKIELAQVENVYYLPRPLTKKRRNAASIADLKMAEGFPSLLAGDQIKWRYKIGRKVGRGADGLVIKATDMAVSRQRVAVKLNAKHRRFDETERRLLHILYDGLGAQSQSHVMQLIDEVEYRGWKAYVFPFYAHNWKNLVPLNIKHQPMRYMRALVHDMLLALKYLREKKVLHLNVQPDNILFDVAQSANGGNNGTGPSGSSFSGKNGKMRFFNVLTDFSTAKHITQMPAHKSLEGSSLAFMAPERLYESSSSSSSSIRSVSYAADMWSLGATLFTILSGDVVVDDEGDLGKLENSRRNLPARIPLRFQYHAKRNGGGEDEVEIIPREYTEDIPLRTTVMDDLQVIRGRYEQSDDLHWFDLLVDFIGGCLQWDPSMRWTVEQALQHELVMHYDMLG